MLNAIFRPLEKWPGEPTPDDLRVNSPFKAGWNNTINLLEYELAKIWASNIVIQVEVQPWQIRNDGWLKGGIALRSPAVLLTFTGSDGAAYAYPCDTFADWRDNLRAIALALEALRKVDRYGVTRRGEQYQGFRALPPPAEQRPKLEPSDAALYLSAKTPGVSAEGLLSNQKLFEAVFRMCQQQLHPDAGGSHDDFVQLQEAGAVLKEHFDQQAKGAAQ